MAPRLASIVRRLVAVPVLATLALGVGGASTARADITESGYYKMSYGDVIVHYTDTGPGTGSWRPLSYDQWAALGFPAPVTAHSEVVKYAWSPTLYSVTFFEGDWAWDTLTWDDWARMGFQAHYDAGWIAGSFIGRYGSSDELYLIGPDDSQHKLTYAEWAATGFHPVDVTRADIGFVRFRGSPVIWYVEGYGTADERGEPLTYQQWLDYGSPTPVVR